MKYEIIGNGSNILVSDNGYDGVIIKPSNFNEITIENDVLYCQSGALLSKIGTFCQNKSKSGFEALCGIPATIGGAICMNAGAYGSEISDILISSTYLDNNGEIKILDKNQHDFSYRHSFYIENPEFIILEAKFAVKNAEKEQITADMLDFKERRISKQPLNFPSAGSTFKRPEGYFAGKLIEDAGLKGFRIGGACVSEKHAGFVINDKNATCLDVLNLIEEIKKQVFEKFDVKLECEIKMIGD